MKPVPQQARQCSSSYQDPLATHFTAPRRTLTLLRAAARGALYCIHLTAWALVPADTDHGMLLAVGGGGQQAATYGPLQGVFFYSQSYIS